MRQSTRFILAATVAAGLVAAFVPNTAGAFDATGQKCRASVSKGGAKLTKTYAKIITACQSLRDVTGSMSNTDCNDLAIADIAGSLPDTESKFASSVDKSCSTSTPSSLLYLACPAPCDAGTPTITTFSDVSECLTCLGRYSAETLGSSAFGLPTPALTGAELACHSAIQKNVAKFYNTVLKNVIKCQSTDEKTGDSTVTNCTETSFNSLVFDSYTKTRDAVVKACTAVTLPSATLDACGGADTVDELAGCVAEAAWAKGKIIVTDYLSLPSVVTTTTTTTTTLPSATGCPDRGELTLYSKLSNTACSSNADCTEPRTCDTGLGLCTTVATLDSGWTGLAHDSDIDDGVTTRAVLQCENPASPACGECNVTGIDAEPGNCRCSNNSRQVCGDPFATSSADCPSCQGGPLNGRACGEDADCALVGACARRCSNDVTTLCTVDTDCPGGTCPAQTKCANGTSWSGSSSCTDTCEGTCSATSACECFFGAPFPLNSGGTPACVVNRFSQNISGTADVDAGSGEISASLRSRVYLGATQTTPCPVCNGDPVPDDGTRGGLCQGGETSGLSCDAMGYSPTSPAQFGASGGGYYSLDCLPSNGSNVSGNGLRIVLNQTTGAASLSANVDCDGAGAGTDLCPCLVCSGDTGVPCNSDNDCAAAGGTCSSKGSGIFPSPNQCEEGACNDVGGGKGQCATGPFDHYCDGLLKPDGTGILACQTNADCAPGAVGGAGGNCTLAEIRKCFLDPIVATGQSDPEFPVAVATFCVPPTSNGGINTVAGLPGAGRVISQGRGVTFCASDRSSTYDPGVGNCPP